MTTHIGLMSKLNKKEVQRQERRIQSLDQERRKLLQMAYADALLREEQRRITDEIAQAERIKTACEGQYDRIQRNLDRALKILDDIHGGPNATAMIGGSGCRGCSGLCDP